MFDNRRGVPFGTGGPGAIYRIDLATGDVTTWATVPAGPDRHDLRRSDDERAAQWVGRSSLGDLDLTDDSSQLIVVNLYDGHLYRDAFPARAFLGKFRNGASGTAHAAAPWPFGMVSRAGWFSHAVVNTDEEQAVAILLTDGVYTGERGADLAAPEVRDAGVRALHHRPGSPPARSCAAGQADLDRPASATDSRSRTRASCAVDGMAPTGCSA